MSGLVRVQELDVVVDHRLFGLVDEEGQAGERPATPGAEGLVAANATMLYLQTPEDVLDTRLRVEVWDGPADFTAGEWPVQGEAVMDLPSGRFLVDEIAAGGRPAAFQLPAGGRWCVRAAWRPGALDEAEEGPEGWALVQFWPGG
ncbi:hypothetical protein ACFCZ1_28175 [Streptomyces sp. NPDC056224]|uniref:hypothetical protein n=1 Tax=Streptomyces sp. NPDC056224 TaxID=3345750 RepID=UPI0035E1CA17